MGEVGGKQGRPALDPHAPGARTDPAEARAFVADSGVDALAVAIGSTHAMTSRTATLDHDLLKRLADRPWTSPRSCTAPPECRTTNSPRRSRGGIAKVNVGTALNIAMTGAIREFLAAHPEAVDSRKYLGVGREPTIEAARRIILLLGR